MRIPSRPVSSNLSASIPPLVGSLLVLALFVPLSSLPVVQRAQTPLPPADPDFDPIVIEVLAGAGVAHWRVNGTPMQSLAELQQRLAPIARIKRDAPIVIEPIGDVPRADMNEVIELLRLIGFERIQLEQSAK